MFVLDPDPRCNHINFIDRTDGSISCKDEFLFSPYFSAFAVLSAESSAHPHWTQKLPYELQQTTRARLSGQRTYRERLGCHVLIAQEAEQSGANIFCLLHHFYSTAF